uniref:OSJNBb0089K06.11 protein n=1 Tax=Oryza sativa subsp. japonica TaxID=39947 RepID=Q7XNZ6_ORYSJ|nr:OSJNBb0089K06.11 [Oryza sativa Japonica Group]
MAAADATTARLHSVQAAAPPASPSRSRLHAAGSGGDLGHMGHVHLTGQVVEDIRPILMGLIEFYLF